MARLFQRFGFVATVGVVALLLIIAAIGKGIFAGGDEAGPGPGKGKAQAAAIVVPGTVARHTFHDAVKTIGTAQARESVAITPKVTDVIARIRFDSGQRVAKGQVLVELANIEQSADLAEARAELEVRKRDLQRIDELGKQGFASNAQIEASRASTQQAEARVRALQSRIGDRVIRAPFSGVMGLRVASPGALVRPGDIISTLDDISIIKLDFDVSESQLAQVKRGAEIVALSAAFPGERFVGKVDSIDTRVDEATRTLRARALIANPQGRIKPGMLMTVESRSNRRESLAVPEIAVQERADGSFVLLIGDDNKAREAKIQTGERADGYVEVMAGATEGARIVVEGQQRVRPGQSVRFANEPPTALGAPAGKVGKAL